MATSAAHISLALGSWRPSYSVASSLSPVHVQRAIRHPSNSSRQCRRRQSVLTHASLGPQSSVLSPELKDALDKFVAENKVVLFMKGTKNFPQCGFSNTCVMILNELNVPFEAVNILEDDRLRQGLKEYSSWPTFPQLYIDGEFFGGCDITIEAYKNGELQETVNKALLS